MHSGGYGRAEYNLTEVTAVKHTWKERIYNIIFESDTPAGKFFDVALIICIVLSVSVVMLDSVAALSDRYRFYFYRIEWFFTLLFTVEYILRLFCINKPMRYATSYYGVIDLLSILPTYLSLFVYNLQFLLFMRILRVLRIFRTLQINHYADESTLLMQTLRRKKSKILVFLCTFMTLLIVIGALMYLIENETNPRFSSIPISIYWAVITLTTVGYGDIVPITSLGKAFSALVMIIGYSILAAPGVYLTTEMVIQNRRLGRRACPNCSLEGHDIEARCCQWCGFPLTPEGE